MKISRLPRYPALALSEAVRLAEKSQRGGETWARGAFPPSPPGVHEAFWLTDWRSRRVRYISPGYEAIWGRSPQSLYDEPRSWAESIHPDDRQRVERLFVEEAETGGYDVVYRIVRPDGGLRWIHDRAFPISDETGRVTQVGGISEDITRFVEAEERSLRVRTELEERLSHRDAELTASLSRYRALVDASPDAVIILDTDGRLRMVNQRAVEFYGGEELVGPEAARFTDYIVESEREKARERFGRLLTAGSVAHDRYTIRRADGGCFPADISATALVVGDRLDGVIVILRDVSDYVAVESSLRHQRDLLFLGAEISSNLVNSPVEGLSQALEEALSRLGGSTGVDRVSLWGGGGTGPRLLAQWVGGGLKRLPEAAPGGAPRLGAHLASLWASATTRSSLVVEDAAGLAPESTQADLMRELGSRSLVGVFLTSAGETTGLLLLEMKKEPRRWDLDLQLQLRVIGEHLAAALERLDSHRRLQGQLERLRFLSTSALELVSLPPTEDLYRYTAEKLRDILEAGYVLVSSYDAAAQSFELRSLVGSPGPIRSVVTKLGRRFIGESFPISDKALAGLRRGSLQRVKGGLHELAAGDLSRPVATFIEKALGVGAVYSIGILNRGELVGSIAILLERGQELRNREIFEGFLGQAVVALQRRRAEDELRRSRQEYRELIKHNPDLIARVDKKFRYLYVNDAVTELFGVKAEDLVGRLHSEALGFPQDFNRIAARLSRIFERGEPLEMESGLELGGEYHYYHVRLVPEFADDGVVESVLLTARDITGLKLAERRLSDSEERYRLTLDSLDDAVHLVDGEMTIRLVNEALLDWCAGLGLTTELLGRPLTEVFPFLGDKVIEEYREVFNTGSALETEDQLVIDGRRLIMRTRKIPIRGEGEDGSVERVVTVLRDITAAREAEEALRESEQLQRALFDGSTDPVVLTDLDGVIVAANPANEKVFGFPAAGLIGRSVLELTAGADEQLADWLGVCEEGLGVSGFESRRPRRGGEPLPVSVSVSPVNDAEGRLRYLSFWFRDIGALRSALDRLALSERKHRLLLESIPSPVVALRHDLRILYCNPAFASLVGRPLDELEGRPLGLILPELADDELRSTYEQVLTDGERRDVERRVSLDGRELYLRAGVHPMPWGLLILADDITEAKRQELKLLHLNRVMQGLRAAGQRAVEIESREELVYEYVSRLAEEGAYAGLWIATPREAGGGCHLVVVQGTTVEEASLEEPPACVRDVDFDNGPRVLEDTTDCPHCRMIKSASAGGSVLLWDLRHGESRLGWIGAVLEAELRVDEQQLALFSEAAADLAAMLHRLGLIERGRRSEAERERLNRQLVAKNQELEQIVYITSHDLRSPLLNIQGFSGELRLLLEELSGILRREELPERLRRELEPRIEKAVPEALGFINSSVYRMDALLSGLLRLSRLGRHALRHEDLDVGELLEEIRLSFMYRIEEQGVRFVIDDPPPCRADRDQLGQLFSNLIDNALKYLRPEVSGEVTIGGRREAERVVYWVRDNGIGIPAAERRRVFEVFQSLEQEGRGHWADADAGDGLGLSIVRRILERHGGEVWVESTPGEGSVFYVSLPVLPGDEAVPAPDDRPAQGL